MNKLSGESKSRMDQIKVGIIGIGRVGAVLAGCLDALGVNIIACWDIDETACVRFQEFTSYRIPVTSERFIECNVLFFSVPDGMIVQTVTDAIGTGWVVEGCHVIHMSGSLGIDILKLSIQDSTIHIGAFHPYMAFPTNLSPDTAFKGIGFGITAESVTQKILWELARALGGFPVAVAEKQRLAYHLSAVVASNFSVILEIIAGEILKRSDFPESTARSLVRGIMQSVQNNLTHTSPENALSGPVVRNDQTTINAHKTELEQNLPEYLLLYAELSRQIESYLQDRALPSSSKSAKVSPEN